MTSSETLPPAPAPVRRLRRSTTDRVGAGVAGGLGEYFRVDPILFRVGFAVGAFFGGAGVLAYLVAWAVIPIDDNEPAPVDRWIVGLRARRFPAWLIALAAALLFWSVAFSWWWPHPVWPLLPAGIIALAVLAVRDGTWHRPPPVDAPGTDEPGADEPVSPDAQTVSLEKDARPDRSAWVSERRRALQERRRRAWPLRAGAFAAVTASLADGIGDKTWTPVAATELHPQYRLAMGNLELDLRSVALTTPTDVRVRSGFGRVRIVVPRGMNATVDADLHLGGVVVDGEKTSDDSRRWGPTHGGFNVERTVPPLAGATGPAVHIHIDLAAGEIQIDRM